MRRMCQRPERAFFISTRNVFVLSSLKVIVCQRPERAFFISTKKDMANFIEELLCQRPERAFFISTKSKPCTA